jgi:membrane protease YdiL (CAAX protease family)
VTVTPAAAEPLDAAAGDRYPQLLRTPQHRWWRPLVGLLLAAVVVILGSIAVILVALAVEAVRGNAADPRNDSSLDADTPMGLLANNLVIAMLIPAAMLAVWAAHRAKAGWLGSVTARLRWSVLGRFFVVAFVVVVAFFVASFLIPPAGLGDIDVPSAGTLVGLLAVILVTTPLQSAAEEVGFRGYLSQAVASWFARPLVGSLVAGTVSATVFAFAHGGQEPALFADRFAFGAIASWLVWRTGGLEASIALHAANNLVSLGYTAATGSVQESLENSSLDWPYLVLDVVMMLVFAGLANRLATRWKLEVRRPVLALPATRGGEPSLSGPNSVGYPGSRSSTPPPVGEGEPPWGMG